MPNGTIKNVQRTYDTKKEAQLNEQLFKIDTDNINQFSFETIYQHFLNYKENKMQYSSKYNMKKLFDLHILPDFGKKNINKITSLDIINWQNRINKTEYSIKYKTDMFVYLSAIFKYAVKHFELESNPMLKVDKFSKDNKKVNQIDFWTLDEFNKFITAVDDHLYKLFFQLLFYSGIRRGECEALTWNDVLWDSSEINIERTVKSARGTGSQYIGIPKTSNAYRKIVLPDLLITNLKEHYDREKLVDGFSNKCYVFGTVDFIKNSTLERRKNYYCKLSDVKQIRIHDFRHSHAALLINQGISLYILSKRLGHAKIEITANLYGHLYPSVQLEIKDTLNSITNIPIKATK